MASTARSCTSKLLRSANRVQAIAGLRPQLPYTFQAASSLPVSAVRGFAARRKVRASTRGKSEKSLEEILASCALGEQRAASSIHSGEVSEKAQSVISLFTSHGRQNIETMHLTHAARVQVSLLDHSLQTAKLARQAGADDDTIVAALIHDCGHVLGHKMPQLCGWKPDQAMRHMLFASSWMRQLGFPERVMNMIAHRPNARRYLCYKDPEYFGNISEEARTTVLQHGGRMSSQEASVFETVQDFETILQLLRWCDEAAVSPSRNDIGDFEQYRSLLEASLLKEYCKGPQIVAWKQDFNPELQPQSF